MTVQIGALELAELLGLPAPTDQQVAVIEAPLTPALVVAGAGSGKTETMANRVVWLVANGRLTIDQVLGLTFTRKAAGELASRISTRIAQLAAAGIVDESEAGSELRQATVSTYNAFANSIFRENALIVGREPESVLLNEASAWQLARQVVSQWGDDRLVPLERRSGQLADAVLELSHEMSENVAESASVAELATRFSTLLDLPITDGRAKSTPYVEVEKAVSIVAALPALVDLADRYALEKRRRGLVEFSDQVALALEVCDRSPAVVDSYRDRYRVVILDEYQDTSVVQTRLLAALFADHGVMAVGDPNQSIYGWRGASAANLALFAGDFARTSPARRFALSTSWRNARVILAAANATVAEFRERDPELVEKLVARDSADDGTVTVEYPESIREESDTVAHWLKARLAEPLPAEEGDDPKKRSAAILFRNRRHMAVFAADLDRLGVPNHILGIGGLLSTPEIVDLVSALRVINDPTAGSALLRLLAGARWSVGLRDLKQLSSVAGWLSKRDWAQAPLADELLQKQRESVVDDDGRSIVDALDFVSTAKEGHSQLAGFTPVGLERLRAAGRQLQFLRSRGGLALLDLVRLVEQELLLDIEVAANSRNVRVFGNLDAFHDEVANFLSADDLGTLGSFLSWLDRAERNDTMGPRSESAEPGSVQLLTIHGAKGLEWDAVVVPRLVKDELPGSSREGLGWVRFGKLPYDFRGDRDHLPVLEWFGHPTQKHVNDSLAEFKDALAVRHHEEERRLAYVAITRAKHDLLLTGSFWAGNSERPPSVYLTELAEAGIIEPPPEASELDENPETLEEHDPNWPLPRLGGREEAVLNAAELVRTSAASSGGGADTGRWTEDVELLLEERRARALAEQLVELPVRVPASRFKDFVSNPGAVAASLRRPMPERPYRATRLGTLFHAWVEQRLGVGGTAESIDAFAFELDDPEGGTAVATASVEYAESEQAALDRLIEIFEGSPWASRSAVEVEREIHLPLAGRVVVCKIDAVFSSDGERFEVVDWKTGKAPKDEADLESKQLQLALYRQAFAEWKGIDPDVIDAVFYYVADDEIIRPKRLWSRAELETEWAKVVPAQGPGTT
ncbi:MAG: ATP-dependent helicase [Microbacteriaceae bacterium]|nr:ATP-dependent helicase [Microbacteriaceae bacterium]